MTVDRRRAWAYAVRQKGELPWTDEAMAESSSRHRWAWVMVIVCVVIGWGVASWLGWSEIGIRLKAVPGLPILLLPVLFLSWPAHEVALVVAGLGAGANARCPATAWTLTAFLLQAVVTWLPLAIFCLARFKLRFLLVVQCAVLLILFVFFWFFGNG